jgi:acyl dehydratase
MTRAVKYYWEDFVAGESVMFGRREVTLEEIIAFAREYDAQPFHLDEEAAKASLLGGLAASGWHVCALMMRMCWDAYVHDSTGLGSPGIEEMRWIRPVRPGHILSIKRTVLEAKRSRSRPEMGLTRMRHDLMSQDGELLARMEGWMMFGVRDPGVVQR